MRTAVRGALALMVVLALPVAVLADHSWGTYHWARTSNPFNLKVGNNMTGSWPGYYSAAIADWNCDFNPDTNSCKQKRTVLNLITVPGSSGKRCNAVSGTVQVCNGKYGYNGWLGLATIWLASGTDHITQGTTKMNDSYFSLSTYNNPNEKRHVVCQEVGHTFGLDHQDESGADFNTCMDYFSNTGVNATNTHSIKPNAGDYDELLCKYVSSSDAANYVDSAGNTLVYGHTITSTTGTHTHSCTVAGHLDSTNTAAASIASSPAGKGADTDDPNEWGTLVSQSANGRSSTYERYEADGSTRITHVYWTVEAAQSCPGCDHRYDH